MSQLASPDQHPIVDSFITLLKNRLTLKYSPETPPTWSSKKQANTTVHGNTFAEIDSFFFQSPRHWKRQAYISATDEVDDHMRREYLILLACAWLHHCLSRHQVCQLRDGDVCPLPSRLIDVGLRTAEPCVRLIDTTGQQGIYAALSYRWNTSKAIITTNENIEQHKQGIEVSRLSRTMQDAIGITRELGIRYIWIDAFCIIQDSRKDWSHEVLRMAAIYKNAIVTIACVDASNAKEGCFWAQSLPEYGAGVRQPGLLDSRAWVLQEQLLSPRVLSFSRQGLFWDCVTCNSSECHPQGIPVTRDHRFENRDFRLFKEGTRLGKFVTSKAPFDENLHAIWQKVVMSYTARQLTNTADRLLAIRGLCDQVSFVTGHKFAAGMWQEQLASDLSWHVPRAFPASPWTGRTPTTSYYIVLFISLAWLINLTAASAIRDSTGFKFWCIIFIDSLSFRVISHALHTFMRPLHLEFCMTFGWLFRFVRLAPWRAHEPTAPSWSWGSVSGPVQYTWPEKSSSKFICQVHVLAINSQENVHLAQYEGRIRLRGQFVIFRFKSWPDRHVFQSIPGYKPYSDEVRFRWYPDRNRGIEPIFSGIILTKSDFWVQGLVLEPVGWNLYRRVGLAYWSPRNGLVRSAGMSEIIIE